jgi:hypothetical protein
MIPFWFGFLSNFPSDMDKLVSVKGLVIRTTPIIPDMKEGTIVRLDILLIRLS